MLSTSKLRKHVSDTNDPYEREPLHHTVVATDPHDDIDVDGKDGSAGAEPPRTGPPPIFRHIRDTHPPPTYAHVLVNRFLLRVFPRVVLVVVVSMMVVALLPGGWRVALCSADIVPPPEHALKDNFTIIGHRGCEFPYPANSLEALDAAVNATRFVEFDIALTSDRQVILMHDIAFDRTTNGSGLTCMSPLSYSQSLSLNVPERNPQGRIAHGKFCTRKRMFGVGTVPCTYRVPTLSSVFDELPTNTRFMIDVKACYAPGISVSAALCSNCSLLLEGVRTEMRNHFIKPERIVFTSTQTASLAVFRGATFMQNSSFALSADPTTYSHYKASTFIKLLDDAGFDAVSMHVGLAAVRPDLVYAIRNSPKPHKPGYRDLYTWTIRRDFEYKLARCAGASKFIAAEPDRLKKRITWKDVGSLLAEAT